MEVICSEKGKILNEVRDVHGHFTIPETVSEIGDNAFDGCTGLTSIEIPDSVQSIGERAFRNCTGLASIHIPDSVTEIERYAFEGCINLREVHLLHKRYNNA